MSVEQGLLPLLVRVVIPYILGAIALGIGVLAVGGNSEWLWAFVVPAVIGGWWLIWPRSPGSLPQSVSGTRWSAR